MFSALKRYLTLSGCASFGSSPWVHTEVGHAPRCSFTSRRDPCGPGGVASAPTLLGPCGWHGWSGVSINPVRPLFWWSIWWCKSIFGLFLAGVACCIWCVPLVTGASSSQSRHKVGVGKPLLRPQGWPSPRSIWVLGSALCGLGPIHLGCHPFGCGLIGPKVRCEGVAAVPGLRCAPALLWSGLAPCVGCSQLAAG